MMRCQVFSDLYVFYYILLPVIVEYRIFSCAIARLFLMSAPPPISDLKQLPQFVEADVQEHSFLIADNSLGRSRRCNTEGLLFPVVSFSLAHSFFYRSDIKSRSRYNKVSLS